MTNFEIEAVKQDLLFSKEDIIKYIKERIEEINDDEKTLTAYKWLLGKVQKTDIPDLYADWDKENIHCYVFFSDSFNFVECDVKDFWFTYDNYSHELYLESFTSENEKEIL